MEITVTETCAARIKEWLTSRALPLWAGPGFDSEQGGFVERLHADGAPDLAAPKRIMVQARQIYVYSHAALLGLDGCAAETAHRAGDFLLCHGCPEGAENGFAHALHRDGQVHDDTRDAYDHAFVLFALSWLYRATGDGRLPKTMRAVLAGIDRHLLHLSGQGYSESSRPGALRRQNSHMHLFEAFLAAFTATGDEHYLDRATVLFHLFERYFFQPGPAVLLEYFDDGLAPALGTDGRLVEPGHHFEWVWLLDRYAAAAGVPVPPQAGALYATAQRYGIEPHTDLAFDEIWMDGTVKAKTKRSWPQTERLKAALVMDAGGDKADALVEGIFRHFLAPAVPGAWCDRLDAANRPQVASIPASSFYHLFLAFSEYLRLAAPAQLLVGSHDQMSGESRR